MILSLLLACGGYELVAAEATFHLEPVDEDSVGAYVDTTVPMRLETYGPEFQDGIELSPYFGFVQTDIQADVDCLDSVVLDASVSNDQVGILLTPGLNEFDGLVGGHAFTSTHGNRRGGSFSGELELRFPCAGDQLVLHRVDIAWARDDGAPIPYNDVP